MKKVKILQHCKKFNNYKKIVNICENKDKLCEEKVPILCQTSHKCEDFAQIKSCSYKKKVWMLQK